MAYIYEIYNDINDKVYIGKTECSIEKRFKQHCQEAFKQRSFDRPLYRAMRKYGI
jgi:predicted GIY-YIG superfamily endonuclease